MKAYVYFRSASHTTAARCLALFNQAHGGPMTYIREAINVDNDDAPLGEFGVPVGAGSEAGTNPGCAMIEAVRSRVIAGPISELTSAERVELLDFISVAVELEHDWSYNQESPHFPLHALASA